MIREGDALFVKTGPTTIAGRYLRRYWQPVSLSRDVRRGRAVPIRVMSEDFTLYRDESGAPHVVAARCPHRLALLSLGVVKGDTIACAYHGWRFASSGECLEQPAESKAFCEKISIASHPTTEAAGVIFAYFGPYPAPPLPKWPDVGDFPYRHRIDCNYFQSAENIVDDVHLMFAHRNSLLRTSTRMGIPQVSASETSFGLTVELRHLRSTERNHFIMPNACYLVDHHSWGTFRILFFYVPIDDTHHNHFFTLSLRPRILGCAMSFLARYRNVDEWYSRAATKILMGKRSMHSVFSPRLQDTVMCVSQGEIVDRELEHLGSTDAGVNLLRLIWQRELRKFTEGENTIKYQASPTDLTGLT